MIRAYECNVIGTNWQTVIHAQSAGKARYLYWLDVHEYY